MVIRADFGRGWSLRLADEHDDQVPEPIRAAMPIPASVPGTVHTDLLSAGLIPDPYLDGNEELLRWIGATDWVYGREFEHTPADGEELVLLFEGLDTVATISVNGQAVAHTENMHRRYEVPLTDALRAGSNRIEVAFTAPRVFGERERERMGELPSQYPGPFNYFRKSACTFGWDWGPDLASSGIWRPVTLIRSRTARVREVRPTLTVDTGAGTARFEVELDRVRAEPVIVEAVMAGIEAHAVIAPGATSALIELVVPDAELWWPRGFGEQASYPATVTLRDAAGIELDAWSRPLSFRSVELDTAPDADGSPFRIVVNGVTIPIRGVNWIPDDCFFPRVTAERVRERITQAIDANVNLLRVWGGGTYESEDFYRVCDEAGVLVWQDFLFACAAYPEDERLADEVDAEARDNVARLMPHPSLILWNGNNENLWGYLDWDWAEAIGNRPWGPGYYFGVLPRAVAEVDPSRPYWPGSPYSGTMAIHPNDEDHGLTHIWDVWNQADFTVYRDHRPRFASEFGWQAPPSWSTMLRSIHDDPLTPTSPGMRAHQKAEDGELKLERGILAHLPEPRDLTDWHYSAQLIQAQAVRLGVEHLRSLRPRCWGTIVWQLNDCWPVTSWSAVDGDGRKKPLWYSLRAAYRSTLLTIQPRNGRLCVVAVNDTPAAWNATIRVRRMSFDGELRAEFSAELRIDALGATTLELPSALADAEVPNEEMLVADSAGSDGEERALWFFADDRELALKDPGLSIQIARDGADAVVTVTAGSLTRELCLFPDRIAPAAEADTALITLLAGETQRIRVRGIPEGRERELASAPVLRTLNELVTSSRQASGSGS
jgi:beta-mannosidase